MTRGERNFEVGDKVFDIRYGWGEVLQIGDPKGWFPIVVRFKNDPEEIVYAEDGRSKFEDDVPLLSFTEYTLHGFTAEKPIDYNKFIGKWGMFWSNKDKDERIIGKLEGYDDRYFKSTTSITLYAYFKPLTDEQIKSLGL